MGRVDAFHQALREAEKRGRSVPVPDTAPLPSESIDHEPEDEPDFGEAEPSFDDADFARSAQAFEGFTDIMDAGDGMPEDAFSAPRQSRPKPSSHPSASETSEKPRLTLDEAIQRIDPEARRVLTEVLKGQFKEVRSYRKR